MARVRLVCGTQRAGREDYVDRLIRERWGRALLLTPTRHYALRRAERLVLDGNLDGIWGRPVLSFDDFAEELLRSAGRDPVRLRDHERRFLLQRTAARLRDRGVLEAWPAAETPGFLSHMLRIITGLKQAAIDPDEFRRRAATRRRPSPLDGLVAEFYSEYQRTLLEAGVYDLPGLFWEADLLCRKTRPPLLENIDLLVLDGFDDFTPSEFRLIAAAAPHVAELVFGLNYDTLAGRADLFALPARTAQTIRRHFKDVALSELAEAPPESFTEYASSTIFWRDPPQFPEGLRRDLDLAPCADFTQEIEQVGRRVKRLILEEGVPTGEIAVVFADLRAAAATARSVFEEFGLPARFVQDPALWESSLCAFVLRLLDAAESWERDLVAGILTSPWFPASDGYAIAMAHLARKAQIIAGRNEWKQRVQALAARLENGDGEDRERLLRNMPDAVTAAQALLDRLDGLDALLRRLPVTAAPAQFAEAIEAVLEDLGAVAKAGQAYSEFQDDRCEILAETVSIEDAKEILRPFRQESSESEQHALAALQELLAEWKIWTSGDTARQSRAEFAAAFRQALREVNFAVPQPRDGVACLDVDSIRHLRFEHVFFVGVNEGAVPRPSPMNAIYSDEDIASLAEAGVVVESRRAFSDREALAFHHVLQSARTHLEVSWHAIGRGGKQMLASPYVSDILGLFPEGTFAMPSPRADALTPEISEAASWRDLRNLAFDTCPALRETFRDRFAPVIEGAAIEAARHDAQPFGAYDGVLRDPARLEAIAARYGAAHLFSVDQLETYAACPFSFFAERVLRIEATEIPVAEFDARVRGTILHAVLQAFHQRYRGRAVVEIPGDEAAESMRAEVERVFEEKAWRSVTAPRGVETAERNRLVSILDRYLAIAREDDPPRWKPEHFETAFGKTPRNSGDTILDSEHPCPDISGVNLTELSMVSPDISRSEAYALETPLGPVLFSGRIDRIDLDGGRARIIDYKSSTVPALKDIREGRSLQLAVYALALEEFLSPGLRCEEALFVRVGYADPREALGRTGKKDDWPERERIAREAVARCVAGIRAGRFAPSPPGGDGACAYCAARSACRYETVRIERKGGAT